MTPYARSNPTQTHTPPESWWEDAFALIANPSEQSGHPCGHKEMLTLVGYDIADSKRLAKVARYCEDHGVRVQYSFFECRLEADKFDVFWLGLEELIEPKTDRLVAYRICHACAKQIFTAGTMELSGKAIAYVF